MGLTLVLGGTRSGKSSFAEALALDSGLPVRYVATADPGDGSMGERIAAHVARRPAAWDTVVAGDDLGPLVSPGRCVLIDGLGTWIAGVMYRSEGAQTLVREEVAALARAAAAAPDPVIVVAEQAGEGLLPADALSRAWLDLLGEATQALSQRAERAVLVVAGRAIELPARIEAGTPADAAGLRRHGDTLVRPGDADHAVNVLAGGPPAWLRAALTRALEEDISGYPREDAATAALAVLHGRDALEIVPTNGAAQALWLLPAALRPRLAACVHPGFTEAEAALRAHAIPVARVMRRAADDFALDPAAVPQAADLVIVGNPASPSGTLDALELVLALRRPGRVVVVDEAFMDLVPGETASLVRDVLPDVIVVRSMTKSLAIPGLRAGYAVAPPPLADRLRAVRPPWSCNALALAALRAIAQRPEALTAAAQRAQAERGDLERRLAQIAGLRTWPAAANYVLVRVSDGAAVTQRLRDEGIAVRPAGSFPGLTADDLRITARAPQDNARLADVLAAAVAT
ncbi:MAG TPA: bifunctional adenosylcobinamide kinase/adenosylcobinamide-phosphate guanylyltransferase [Solirubrobacteraceae bacterium]|nr:bifunctional adenosylcobinamide kinase/adenosylcobinamide-phosphate guanylyltransferase [Solirubrobacteraceae bacterium]